MFHLLSGLLHYRMETDYPVRFWKAKKQLILLDRALLESRQRTSDLIRISERTPDEFGVFQGRIAGRSERIHDLRSKVDGFIEKQGLHINQLGVDEIRQQQLHLVQLRLNAHYELAKLHDKLAAQQ